MQSQNQFKQTAEKGQLDLRFNPSVISCQIDASENGTLVPGQAVTLVDSAGGIPKVVAAAADTDAIFGFISYDIKSKSFKAEDRCEVVFHRGSIMFMESSAAIARGAKVMTVISGQKVATATAGKTAVGIALDKATAGSQIIRVLVDLGVQEVGAAVTVLNQNISAAYVEAEVQAISTKVDEVITALKAVGVLS